MKAPKFITWLVAVFLGVLAVLLHTGVVSINAPFPIHSFWVMGAGMLLLVLSTIVPGL